MEKQNLAIKNIIEKTLILAKEVSESKDLYYKATDSEMKCRDFKYELNKEYSQEGKPRVCSYGFHACKELVNVANYYEFNKSKLDNKEDRVFLVKLSGKIDCPDGEKSSAQKIEFIRELSIIEQLIILPLSTVLLDYLESLKNRNLDSIITKYSNAIISNGNRNINNSYTSNFDEETRRILSITNFSEFSKLTSENPKIIDQLITFKTKDINSLSEISNLIGNGNINLKLAEILVDKAYNIVKQGNDILDILNNKYFLLQIMCLFNKDKDELDNHINKCIEKFIKNSDWEKIINILTCSKNNLISGTIVNKIFELIQKYKNVDSFVRYIVKNQVKVNNPRATILDKITNSYYDRKFNFIYGDSYEYLAIYEAILENTLFKSTDNITYKFSNLFSKDYDCRELCFSKKFVLKNLERMIEIVKKEDDDNLIQNILINIIKDGNINIEDYIDIIFNNMNDLTLLDRKSLLELIYKLDYDKFRNLYKLSKRKLKIKNIELISNEAYYSSTKYIDDPKKEIIKKIELILEGYVYDSKDENEAIKRYKEISDIKLDQYYIYSCPFGYIVKEAAVNIANKITPYICKIFDEKDKQIKDIISICNLNNSLMDKEVFNNLLTKNKEDISKQINSENFINFIIGNEKQRNENFIKSLYKLSSLPIKIVEFDLIKSLLGLRLDKKDKRSHIFNCSMGKLSSSFDIVPKEKASNINKNRIEAFEENLNLNGLRRLYLGLFDVGGNSFYLYSSILNLSPKRKNYKFLVDFKGDFKTNIERTLKRSKQFKTFVEDLNIEELSDQQIVNFINLYISNLKILTELIRESRNYEASDFNKLNKLDVVYSQKMRKQFKTALDLYLAKNDINGKNSSDNIISEGSGLTYEIFLSIRNNSNYFEYKKGINNGLIYESESGIYHSILLNKITNDLFNDLLDVLIRTSQDKKCKINRIVTAFDKLIPSYTSIRSSRILDKDTKENVEKLFNIVLNKDKTVTRKWINLFRESL